MTQHINNLARSTRDALQDLDGAYAAATDQLQAVTSAMKSMTIEEREAAREALLDATATIFASVHRRGAMLHGAIERLTKLLNA